MFIVDNNQYLIVSSINSQIYCLHGHFMITAKTVLAQDGNIQIESGHGDFQGFPPTCPGNPGTEPQPSDLYRIKQFNAIISRF